MGVDEQMQDEFGTMAAWTRQAVSDLGPDHAMPAACRGSGRPSGLDWLLTRLGPQPAGRLDFVTPWTGTICARPASVSMTESHDLRHGGIKGLDAILSQTGDARSSSARPGGSS